jgi:copper(I)-binding protein
MLTTHLRSRSLAIAAFALIALVLAACGGSGSDSSTEAASSSAESPIVIAEPVVRASDDMTPVDETTGKQMTGSFMTITNNGSEDVTLEGGSTDAAERIEIHEVIDGEMVPKKGGLVIPAGGSQKLRMGGYHVMLMDLVKPLAAGDEIKVTLNFSDGSTVDYVAPAKMIAMDDEKYGVEADPAMTGSTNEG